MTPGTIALLPLLSQNEAPVKQPSSIPKKLVLLEKVDMKESPFGVGSFT